EPIGARQLASVCTRDPSLRQERPSRSRGRLRRLVTSYNAGSPSFSTVRPLPAAVRRAVASRLRTSMQATGRPTAQEQPMNRMTESELKSIIAAEIADSLAHLGGELSEQRRKALRYYLGEPFGNEVEGRSKIVSTDVADTVEWILPSLLKIFTAGDDVVR